MGDATTTLGDLRQRIAAFVAERDWEQFHTPKDLAISLSIEASELLEVFQWTGGDLGTDLDDEARERVAEELADVMIYGLSLANALDLDATAHILRKMESNAARYPADVYRGRYR